jgi:hypothetical protein
MSERQPSRLVFRLPSDRDKRHVGPREERPQEKLRLREPGDRILVLRYLYETTGSLRPLLEICATKTKGGAEIPLSGGRNEHPVSLFGGHRQTRKEDGEATIGRNPADVGKPGSSSFKTVVKAQEEGGSVRRRRMPCVVWSEIGWTPNRDGDVRRGLGDYRVFAILRRLNDDVRCV